MDFHLGTKKFFPKLIACLVIPVFLINFLAPKFAHAQVTPVPLPTVVTADVPFEAWAGKQEVQEKAKMTLAGSIFVYLINLTSFAVDRLAYDSAVMVASGGPAESPLYDGTPVEQYFKDYGAAVAGDAIGQLQDQLQTSQGTFGAIFSGFDLCRPRANVTLSLNLGVKAAFDRPTPKCDFKSIQNNWKGFVADIQDEGTADNKNKIILTQLADAFDPQTNEFAVGIELQSSIINKALEDSALKAQVRIKEGGFQPVTNFITGNETTPASLINTTFLTAQDNKTQSRLRTINALQSNRDALLQIGIHAGSMFTNTLLSEFTQKLYSGLFNFNTPDVDPFAAVDTIATTNAASARAQYRSLLAFTPLEVTNYSLLADFSSCPSGVARGLYNCVADSSFISAVGRADAGVPMTVAEAVDEGLIDGSWPLIPSADIARDQDPFCYTYGFCYSNLVKLRKARVIPDGWELAANSIYNSVDNTVTLQEVMDSFTDCNLAGGADATHPWCKLIDPNWILEYPETQCKALVNGQLLVSSASNERQQECVDMPSCISKNDDGTCSGGYGYCVAEENIWRFRGESCPAQYASCLTFQGTDKTVSYLQNTVDTSNCSADNAGCLWYSTEKADPEGDGTYDWQPVADVAAADAEPDAYTSRVYFNDKVADCSSENGGCSQLYERDDSIRLNIVQNPSFEDDTNADSIADAWQRSDASVTLETTGTSRSGAKALVTDATTSLAQPGLAVSQGRFYTLSFYARQKAVGGTGSASASLEFLASNPGNDIDLLGTSFVPATGSTCVIENSGNLVNGDGLGDVLQVSGTPAGVAYERYTCTFTSPTVTDPSSLVVARLTLSGDVYTDDVQLEQGETASDEHTGYSTTALTSITVKVPPAYLGCTGEDGEPAACADYAQVCSENDVGCTAYTPANGDPVVTGVANELDFCPATCVGYDTFKQEPTLYEPAGDFPVYFIPDSAQTCSEKDVGCDEFTNLTDESLEYYTSLRSCLTPTEAAANTSSDNSAIFYTWEGSDLAGYQLKTWDLMESNLGGSNAAPVAYTYVSGGVDETANLAPCAHWTTTATGIVCTDDIDTDGDLHKDWDTAACDDHEDIFTNPDCREFYDANGGLHYREWSKTVTVNDACIAYRKTDLVGIDLAAQTANCQNSGGYYDGATGSCRYNGLTSESLSCSASANGCRAYTGGRSRNSRLVLEDTLENGTVSNWDAASAADVTLSNESLATGGHSIAATARFSSFLYNNEVVCANPAGCPGTAQTLGGDCTVENGQQYCGTLENQLFSGKTYTLSFWAKGSGNLTVAFDMGAVPGAPEDEVIFGSVALTNSWQEFSLGPLNMTADAYPLFGADTTLVFDPTALSYIDNITLREGEDNITLIKDSWVTPTECDQSPTGAASPQYYLGCQEYTTQDDETADLKSFSKLCSSDKVGCQDFFMTHESDSPYAEVFKATCANPSGAAVTSATSCYYQTDGAGNFDTASQYLCTIGVGQTDCTFDVDWYEDPSILPAHISYGPSTRVVPADSDAFLVVNDDVTCSSAYAGCTEVGKPDWSADKNSTTGATSTYLINDPDTYSDTLCSQGELFCAAWDTDTDGTFYFKDPQDQTCDYQTGVVIDGTSYDGWFRTGTSDFCYGTCTDGVTSCSSDAQCGTGTCNAQDPSYVINGSLSGLWNNGDDAYQGWVGQCPVEDSTCSEFQDPLDLETNETYQVADGKQYFYLNNDNLDENVLPDSQRCNGQVSLKAGCVLFNDTSEPSQGFNSSASQILSTHADVLAGTAAYSLVDPVNCESGDTNITLADGTTVDLCAQRCLYDAGAVNDISDGLNRGTKLSQEVTNGTPDEFGFDDIYIPGTSCYAVSDCGTMRSQSGKEIEAVACGADARITRANASPTGVEERASVPRLENDTNTVLKVNRDRQCSQWLSCEEDQANWDQSTNSWKTVCSDIELCTKYSSVGGTTFCSEWKSDAPDLVLDSELYTARDTSWYGEELSGYSIPNLFPVQALEQVNVAPPAGKCDLSQALASGAVTQATYNSFHGETCTSDEDCGSTLGTGYCIPQGVAPEYRLALAAGACDGEYATTCSVGFCENTGAACAATSDCGSSGGSCLAGQCQTDTGVACATDDNCSDGEICSGATCVVVGGDVDIEALNDHPLHPDLACDPGEVFAANTSLQIGSCIAGQCLLTPDGKTFDTTTTEGKLCRAQPEVDSPFGNELVDRWEEPGATAADAVGVPATSTDEQPYTVRPGFENVNLCAGGEDCECTYDKVTFGDNGQIQYWSPDSSVSPGTGVCSSGIVNKSCSVNSECNTDPADTSNSSDGVCEFATSENVMLGLEGYCLEKDTAININGDRDEHACLTWLPVDQLAGSTDLYAKSTEAGYFKDTYACTYTTPFVDLKISDNPGKGGNMVDGTIACADFTGPVTKTNMSDLAEVNTCELNASCPEGYWAMEGMADPKAGGFGDDMAAACTPSLSGNNCPYVCIPFGATTPDGLSCDPDSADVAALLATNTTTGGWFSTSNLIGHSEVHFVGASNDGTDADADTKLVEFDAMVDSLKTCALTGVQVTQDVTDNIFNYPFDGPNEIYEELHLNGEFYPGCRDVTQVSDGSKGIDYAWTDRLLGPKTSLTYTTDSDQPGLAFGLSANPVPFGFSSEDPLGRPDAWPLVAATCVNSDTGALEIPNGSAPGAVCGTGQDAYTVGGGGSAENPSSVLAGKLNPDSTFVGARSFGPFTYANGFDEAENIGNWDWTGTDSQVYGTITQLFAGVDLGIDNNKTTWENGGTDIWPDVNRDYSATDLVPPAAPAVSDVRAEDGNPPTLWSLVDGSCVGVECKEGAPNTLSLNDSSSGDIADNSFLRVFLKFYAAADKNQLPIRRVIVDWGDGDNADIAPDHPVPNFQGSDSPDNYYKNHRGLNTATDLSICDQGDWWGETTESCDPNYFSYSHVYTCSATVLANNDRSCKFVDGVLTNSPCWEDNGLNGTENRVCVFQPRVHIEDNWGWCTGTCPGGDDNSDACYSGDGIDFLNDPANPASECGYSADHSVGGPIDPWVYYDGTVTVDPE